MKDAMPAPKPETLGPFALGANNRRGERDLLTKDGRFTAAAVNVDFDDAGRIKRRDGYAPAMSLTDAHSAWSDGVRAFVIDAGVLYALNLRAVPPTKQALHTGVGVRHASYVAHDGAHYMSNEDVLLRIDQDGVTAPLALPQPTSSALPTTGILPAGTYRIAVGYKDSSGAAHAAPDVSQVEVTQGGISLAGLPSSYPPGASLVVYMSEADSAAMFEVLLISTPAATVDIRAPLALGAEAFAVLKHPMPAGSNLCTHGGRLLVAVGNAVFYSEPFSHHLTKLDENYLLFEAPVTLVVAVGTGVFVAADQTYWFPGDPATTEPIAQLPYGAVPGTAAPIPHQNKCSWMTPRGIVLGDQSGEITNVQEHNYVVHRARAGAALFSEKDGMRQMMATLFGTEQTTTAVSSFMDAEIIRKGTPI
jgi:hypothetical protein